MAERGETAMDVTDERSAALFCQRDRTAVRADAPQCLHPSSVCDFREFCEVAEALREKGRGRADG
jgi:hypothetical protein